MDNLMTTYNSYSSVKYDKKGNQIQRSKAQGGWLRELGRSIISVGLAGLAAEVSSFFPQVLATTLCRIPTRRAQWSAGL